MSNNSKKPITVSLVAALIVCLLTFFIGFFASSFILLDSRLEDARTKINELENTVNEKNVEIDNLNDVINQKNESNIILAETITEHLETIDTLNKRVSSLENDVNYVSEVALQSENYMGGNGVVTAVSLLSTSQQLIMLVVLFVIVLFIISVTCGIMATKGKSKRYRSSVEEENTPEAFPSDTEENTSESSLESDNQEEVESAPQFEDAPTPNTLEIKDTPVHKAIELLYSNNLEDCITDLGGYRFGITNFNDVLSDSAKGKSFGVVDNGDFVAFMTDDSPVKRLYIIPRYMALSDSTVALRGVTDLFTVTDEDGNKIDHGTVKIKTVDSPAVFSFGEKGWAIESKGVITAYGKRNYAQ
ncbi:MAG: coiled-coil domain-containing protein [Clostridia bacterium]